MNPPRRGVCCYLYISANHTCGWAKPPRLPVFVRCTTCVMFDWGSLSFANHGYMLEFLSWMLSLDQSPGSVTFRRKIPEYEVVPRDSSRRWLVEICFLSSNNNGWIRCYLMSLRIIFVVEYKICKPRIFQYDKSDKA